MTDIVDRLNDSLSAGYSELRKEAAAEITRLRARIAEMEKQEPVAKVHIHQTGGNAGISWSARPVNDFDALPLLHDGDNLYLAPGAQPAPSALAEAIIADMQAQHDSELITENDSGEALIRLDGAIAAVEDNFALARPAPSVPEDVMRDARRYLWLRNAALDWYVGPEYATYNDVVCSGEYCNYAGGGVALDSAIDALLVAAPEAKP